MSGEGMSGDKKKCAPKGRAPARESVKEFRLRMLRENKDTRDNKKLNVAVHDVYEKVSSSINTIRKKTGIVFDENMRLHKNEYDRNHPEAPSRYDAIFQRFQELELLERCEKIRIREATEQEICKLHNKQLFDNLKKISKMKDKRAYEAMASRYDSIYFNENTFKAACKSAGAVISLCEEIAKGNIQNGFALVRPPGHHAMAEEYNGYCYFNNVALAAKHVLDKNLGSKILIVDHDVHHGQGIQQFFYKSPEVLYFSIHRYENGEFWPNLRESNMNYIGMDAGKGYNINVPLNEVGAGDKDYMAIILHILLPVAYEFHPDLIILSAGYDSCVGCPEGEMKVTPGFYGHLIKLLSGLANGRIAVCLEGGYFNPSLAEGAAMSLKALLDDPACTLKNIMLPSLSVIETINSLKCFLRPYWKCFQILTNGALIDDKTHKVKINYKSIPIKPPHPTREAYPKRSYDQIAYYTEIIKSFRKEYLELKPNDVGYTYDEELLQHFAGKSHVECPDRLQILMQKFKEFQLHERCFYVPGKYVDIEMVKKIHSNYYIRAFTKDIGNLVLNDDDLYCNDCTVNCALKSAGSLINLVDRIMDGTILSGAAFIRPPGHHAEYDAAGGFCFINNVSVAAAYLLLNYNLKKILIVDFDVHHGNGTQNLFYQSNEVLYVSIHRYDDARFYPTSVEGNYDNVGIVRGVGYNVNIPFNNSRMGNFEYINAFHRIILPIAYEFQPEFVLVSAGFDAGINDPLGNYKLTPEVFGHFIQLLKPLANGRIALALEGGYNCTTVAYSMVCCMKTLLGDPLPQLDKFDPMIRSAADSINTVIANQKSNWSVLNVDRPLPKPNDFVRQLGGAI